jgi:hypothetical protein
MLIMPIHVVCLQRDRGGLEKILKLFIFNRRLSPEVTDILVLIGKSNPITSLDSPRGFWEVEAPRYQISQQLEQNLRLGPKGSLPHSHMPVTCPYTDSAHPVHAPTSYFPKIHLNIILPSKAVLMLTNILIS